MPPKPPKPPHWDDRRSLLIETRNLKMASSAHAYVRGSTLKFYEWLDAMAPRSLPAGPPIWICGDCHVGNLGPIANAKGKVEIQIRDFDQTVIGNPVHDLIRLGLSLSMSARGSDLPGVTTARMLEHMVEGYGEEFVAHRRFLPAEKPDAVYDALKKSQGRSWRHLARDRVEGKTASLPLGRRFWPVSRTERLAIEKLFASGAMTHLATRLSHRTDDARVELVDASYWLKGCSSLGLLRYAALLDIESQASAGEDLCLIDIKEAVAPLAPAVDGAAMPADPAERVVRGATQMSPHLGERMAAARLLGKSVFLRELLPEDLKLELDRVSTEQAIRSARYLARVVGRAHARQMSPADRKRWRAELALNHSRSLEAPSWLWACVVDLISLHEKAYLDHCRRYAWQAPPGERRAAAVA